MVLDGLQTVTTLSQDPGLSPGMSQGLANHEYEGKS
jgi:hypothetical protein